MSNLNDSDARYQFAVERSHKDAQISNETARYTAQASILINGAASTAVLAFLAKDNVDPLVLKTAAVCLGLYVVGVISGASMMYCTIRALDFYSLRWRLAAHPEAGANAENNRKLGRDWWTRMRRCFYVSMAAFGISSIILAASLLYSTL